MAKANEIDLALSVMCLLAQRGQTLNTYEIAEVCGCSQTLISATERKALAKLRGGAAERLRPFAVDHLSLA